MRHRWIALLGAGALASLLAAPVATAGERLLRRAFIPSAKNVHGEVRLIGRDDGVSVRTLLYSRALRRGIRKMRAEELRAWPETVDGHEDSTRYLARLDEATDAVLERFAARTDGDQRQTLLIELELAPDRASFALYDVEYDYEAEPVRVVARRPLAREEVSTTYARRAMRLMLASAFEVDEETAGEVLDATRAPDAMTGK